MEVIRTGRIVHRHGLAGYHIPTAYPGFHYAGSVHIPGGICKSSLPVVPGAYFAHPAENAAATSKELVHLVSPGGIPAGEPLAVFYRGYNAHHWVLQGVGMDQRTHLRGEQRISFWDRRRAVLIYQLFVVNVDPVLGAWNAQNLTPAPAVIDLLIAFLPGLLLAIGGLVVSLKEKITPASRLLVIWMLLGFILTFLPFSLQRRFLIGLGIPVAILAMIGIEHLKRERIKRLVTMLMYACMLPTLLVVILLGFNAVAQHNPRIVILKAEENAMAWISTHTDVEAIILASPDIGMFIPAHTGRRVIYGHPFETTFATEKEQEIIGFYSGNWDAAKAEEYLAENHIAYIFWGPREHALGEPAYLEALPMIFSSGDVKILASGTSK